MENVKLLRQRNRYLCSTYDVPGRFFPIHFIHLFKNHFVGLIWATEDIKKSKRGVLATNPKVWHDHSNFTNKKTEPQGSSTVFNLHSWEEGTGTQVQLFLHLIPCLKKQSLNTCTISNFLQKLAYIKYFHPHGLSQVRCTASKEI